MKSMKIAWKELVMKVEMQEVCKIPEMNLDRDSVMYLLKVWGVGLIVYKQAFKKYFK